MADPGGSGPIDPGGASHPPPIDLPPGVPVRRGMGTGAKVAIGCGIGCLVLAIVAVVALGTFFYWASKAPENIEVAVTVPLQAVAGEEVDLVVTITNLADEPQTLDSIDIYDSYTGGIAVTRTDPPYTDFFQVPILDARTYEFKREIPAGGTLIVTFDAVAVRAGDFGGQLDVCINLASSCLSRPVRTVIRE
jgi:hypothetical protein